MKKTLVSMLLVLAFVLGMCGVTAVAEGDYPDKVTILCGLSEHLSAIGITYEDTTYWRDLTAATGTEVEFVYVPSGVETLQQVNLMVADGTLPDIIVGINWNTVTGGATQWYDEGVIIDLTDLIPECMPNYWETITNMPLWEQSLKIDGRMYYITDIQHGVVYRGPVIRQDWLDKAGLESPKTVDDLYEVLTYFKENDMNGNGDPNDEWPMSGLTSIGWTPLQLMWAWGITDDFMLYDGKVTHGIMTEEFTDAITYLNKLYSEGLLDPDYATQDRAALDGKYMNDMVGFEIGMQPTKMNNNKNKEAVKGGFEANGTYNFTLTGDTTPYIFDDVYISLFNGSMAAISGKCEDPEAVLRMIDWIYSDEGQVSFYWGVEHESYEVDENGNKYIDYTGGIEKYPNIDPGAVCYVYSISGTSAFPGHMSSSRFKETMHKFAAEAADKWSSDFDYSRHMAFVTLSAEQQAELEEIITDVNTYIDTSIEKLINGQIPLDEIPNIQAKLIDMGIEKLIDAYQEAYDLTYGG